MFCDSKKLSLINYRYKSDPTYVDWYIVFEPRVRTFWYDFLTDANFRHCWALKYDGFNWIKLYPTVGYTDVEVLPFTKRTDLKKIVKRKRWVYVETNCVSDSNRVPQLFCVWHCVEQIKTLLGIADVRIITPKQLWDYFNG